MNELIEKLKAIGLDEETSHKAVETVLGFVKEKAPEKYHGIIDDLVAGKTPDLGGILGSIGGLGGLFK